MWLHSVEIHLAISAFAFGAAFGLALGMILFWLDKRKNNDRN